MIPSTNILNAMIMAGRYPGIKHSMSMRTSSGRLFQYHYEEFPFSSSITKPEAIALAEKMYDLKYKNTFWDRRHESVNVHDEIVEAITNTVMEAATTIREWEERNAHHQTWLIVDELNQLIAEFPHDDFASAEKQWRELKNRKLKVKLWRRELPQLSKQEILDCMKQLGF